jgi:hypothetical protein
LPRCSAYMLNGTRAVRLPRQKTPEAAIADGAQIGWQKVPRQHHTQKVHATFLLRRRSIACQRLAVAAVTR